MKYENIVTGKFLERPNRFIANVEIDGKIEKVHVKNTGRCRELLIKGATVYLEDFKDRMNNRKLRYSLIAVEKGDLLINMDSQVPNKMVEEALLSGELRLPNLDKITKVLREKTYKDSRFDFYLEDENGNRGWAEVKGVTLEENGICRFPDAPTIRGIKHIEHLIDARKNGFFSYLLLIIQLNSVKWFEPNNFTHKAFGDALIKAKAEGVEILAFNSVVEPDFIKIDKEIEVIL